MPKDLSKVTVWVDSGAGLGDCLAAITLESVIAEVGLCVQPVPSSTNSSSICKLFSHCRLISCSEIFRSLPMGVWFKRVLFLTLIVHTVVREVV